MGLAASLVLLVAAGSVAYAWDGGGEGCGGPRHDTCFEANLVWTAVSTPIASDPSVQCVISILSDTNTLVERATGLAPGESCDFMAMLVNTGGQSLTVAETLTAVDSSHCALFAYTDDIPNSTPTWLASGHALPYHATLALTPLASNSCEGAHASFFVVVTGTPLERCLS